MLTLLYSLLWSYEAVQRNTVRSQKYGPSDPSGIGPLLGILGLSTPDPVPKHLCLLIEYNRWGCVLVLFTMPSLWPYGHGIAARVLSYDASASMVAKDLLSGVLNHDCLCAIATILGYPLLRPLALCSIIRDGSHVK